MFKSTNVLDNSEINHILVERFLQSAQLFILVEKGEQVLVSQFKF